LTTAAPLPRTVHREGVQIGDATHTSGWDEEPSLRALACPHVGPRAAARWRRLGCVEHGGAGVRQRQHARCGTPSAPSTVTQMGGDADAWFAVGCRWRRYRPGARVAGALQLSRDGRYLLAVDAGSNQVSVLRIKPGGSLKRSRSPGRLRPTAPTRSASPYRRSRPRRQLFSSAPTAAGS
jgi:hypothetical protein